MRSSIFKIFISLPIALSLIFCLNLHSASMAGTDGITRLIPADAAAFLLVDFSRNDFSARLSRFFSKTAVLKPQAADPLREAVGFAYSNPDFIKTISSTALIYLETDPGKKVTEKYSPVSFVMKLSDRTGFEKAVTAMKEKLLGGPKGYSRSLVKEGSFEIEILEDREKNDCAAFFSYEDYFILCVGAETALPSAKKIAGTISGEGSDAGSSKRFKAAAAAVPTPASVYFYLDGSFIRKYADTEKLPEKLDFLNSFCFSADISGNRVAFKGAFVTDPESSGNAFTRYFKSGVGSLSAPAMLDTDPIIFLGGKFGFDPAQISGDKALGEIKTQISASLGLDLEKDILSWVGDEFFASFSNYTILALPVLQTPKFYIGVKARDAGACRKCIEKMTAALKNFRETKSGGTSIYHCPVPTPGNVLPDFGITFSQVGGFMVAATSRDAITSLLSAIDRKTGTLGTDPDFMAFTGALPGASNFMFFYNGITGSEFFSSLIKTSANKSVSARDIETLKIIRTAGGGFNISGGILRFESTIELDPLPLLNIIMDGATEKAKVKKQ